MHFAERMRAGPDLEWRLVREVALLDVDHPGGFAVRLHNLGDFYSVRYVELWAELLERHPGLRVGKRRRAFCTSRWRLRNICSFGIGSRALARGQCCILGLVGRHTSPCHSYIYKSWSCAVGSTKRPAPLTATGFSRMIERAAVGADLGIKAHAHMLRHACGYKLANDGVDTRSLQAYLGHRNIQNTTRYTALAPDRFKGFWKD
jgi:hypothetical protein